MGTVHQIAKSSEETHIVFPILDGETHIIPVGQLDKWVQGEELPLSDPMLVRSIINDWVARALGITTKKKA